MKEKQHEEFLAVKESLTEIKREEHENIREMSRKNRKLIEDSRKDLIEKKKHNVSMIKMEKEMSKSELARMVQERYSIDPLRKEQLLKAKLEEHKKNEERKKRMVEQIQEMENTEK
jgi:hypothetical protein